METRTRSVDRGVDHIQSVATAARRGARAVTRWPQLVEDAVEDAIERWGRKLLEGNPPTELQAWSYAVGRNAAKGLLAKNGRRREGPLVTSAIADEREELPSASKPDRPLLDVGAARRRLEELKPSLRGRQYEVVAKMIEPGMTCRRAARELGMSPHNVRRSFRSALARLDALRK